MKVWCVLLLLLVGFVSAEGYYVSNSGNDSWDGKSDATAWRTIEKVNSNNFSIGDDVYFKCGDEWTPSRALTIDWHGNLSDRVIIGAYYIKNGREELGVNGNKPVFDGQKHTIPNKWEGLIQIPGKSDKYHRGYVTVKDFKIVDSGGAGVRSSYANNIIIDNNYINNTWSGGAITLEVSQNSVISNNYVNIASLVDGAGAGIEATNQFRNDYNTTNNWIVNNTVTRAHEGIGLYKGASYNTVENNIVYDSQTYHIYIGTYSHHNIVKNNIVYTSNAKARAWIGIAIGCETFACGKVFRAPGISCSDSNIIYNNLVTNFVNGITLSVEANCSAIGHIPNNNKIYNNIITDCSNNLRLKEAGTGNEVKNTISYISTPESKHIYSSINSKIIFDNNLFSSSSGIVGTIAENGAIFADPNLTKKTGWVNITPGTVIAEWWKPLESNPTIDAGVDVGIDEDFFGNVRDSHPDIGAFEYDGQASQVKTCGNLGGVCCSACAGSAISKASDCATCCSACEVIVLNSSYEIIKGHSVVDGDISEFSRANEIILTSSGAVGKYKLMWDSVGLYISGEVVDDEVNSEIGVRDGNLWDDDSLEIMFDVLNRDGVTRDGNDYKFIVNSDGVEFDNRGINKSWNIDFDSVVRVVDGGYVVEVAIPWSPWGIGAFENDSWGMEVVMNDRDNDGVRTNVWLNKNSGDVNDPDGWGEIVFIGNKVSLSDIFSRIAEWKSGRVSLNEVFVVIRAWGDGDGSYF